MPGRHLLVFSFHSSEPGIGNHDKHFRLGCELVKHGWKVTIVAAANHHWLNRPVDLEGRTFRESINSGVRFLYLDAPLYKGNGLSRAIGLVKVAWKACLLSDGLFPGVTHVMSSMPDPFISIAAWRFAVRNGCVNITEIRDLWSGYLGPYMGLSRLHPFAIAVRCAEMLAVRKANAIVSSLPSIDRYLEDQELSRPFHILPFGISGSTTSARSLPEGVWPPGLDGKFVVGYAGGLIKHNLLRPLFQAAAELREDPRFAFVLFGGGSQEQELRELAESLQLDNLYLAGKIQKEMVPSALEKMSLLYKGTPEIPINRYGTSPIKMNEYMAAGKPIVHLSCRDSDVVERIGCGIRIELNDEASLATVIRRFHSMPKESREEMGAAGRRWVMENLTMERIAEDFDKFLTSIR